jgi:predicted signal transduction protein with EAL and GGDEF domain
VLPDEAGGRRSLDYAALSAELRAFLLAAQGRAALLLIDIPEASRMQARLGFEASETLLDTLAAQFSAAMGARAVVRRFGDARFCVMLKAIHSSGHAVLAAEKLLRVADNVLADSAVALKPEMPLGIALCPQHATDAGDLLRYAQLAATTALQRRERLHVFDAESSAQIQRPWELSESFLKALDAGELQVYFQPKVRVSDNRVVGCEALMRWLDEHGKPVARPDVFMGLAEEAGLMHDATWYSLTNSLRLINDLPGMKVAVNITPGMLHHREFVEMVRTAVSTWHVPSGGLTLEVTEGAIIGDFEQSSRLLNQVRDMGVRVSIDDFGTGYSSLSYFKRIPADELKIDKSFTFRIAKDPQDAELVRTILLLGKQFGLEVVAEGVEDATTLAMLRAMGCDYAQGYFFAQALERRRFMDWVYANGWGQDDQAPAEPVPQAS